MYSAVSISRFSCAEGDGTTTLKSGPLPDSGAGLGVYGSGLLLTLNVACTLLTLPLLGWRTEVNALNGDADDESESLSDFLLRGIVEENSR
jgi:hypothetical protein